MTEPTTIITNCFISKIKIIIMSKNEDKHYVVWKGREPGIYKSWDDANAQVNGYSRNSFKGFDSYPEAKEAYNRPSLWESDKGSSHSQSAESKSYGSSTSGVTSAGSYQSNAGYQWQRSKKSYY
ncbi:hypothetical protein HN51_027310 [Arachis hypogaea]